MVCTYTQSYGFFLKIPPPHSLLQSQAHSYILTVVQTVFMCTAFDDTLKHPDLSTDMALATIQLATQNNR